MQKGIQPPACSVHGLYRTLFSYWLAHCRQSAALFWFGEGMHIAQSFFFGAEIQPKHLVFCYLGFLPGFSLVFCCLPHPMHIAQSLLRKPSFFVLANFFPGFFKSKQLLGFLGVVYMLQRTKWKYYFLFTGCGR
jgi:hypothetical protein